MTKRNLLLLNDESGSALVIIILILLVVTITGTTLATISSMEIKISGNQRAHTSALFVAEAGLAEAIERLSVPNPTTATVGGWTGNIGLSDSRPYDPNWEARIYLTDPGSAPASTGSITNTGTIQDPNSDYMQYSQARGGEGVLTIRHKWVDRNGDTNRDADEIVLYDAFNVPVENFVIGTPIEIVTITGHTGNAVRTIQAEVTRRTVMAKTLGALYVNKPIRITGNPEFCGYDHPIGIPVDTEPEDCFSYHYPKGSVYGVVSTGDDIDIQSGGADAYGEPTPVDSSSANPWYTLADVLGLSDSEVSQLLANAHHTEIDPIEQNGITYIQGDAQISSNLMGEGLLYITGDADISGGFRYRGLIYVEGNLKFRGGGWILGSVINNGRVDYGYASGSVITLYSLEAIQQYIGQYLPMTMLSWREL